MWGGTRMHLVRVKLCRPSGAFIFEIRDGEPVFVYWKRYSISRWLNSVTDEELREAYKNGEKANEYWGYAVK